MKDSVEDLLSFLILFGGAFFLAVLGSLTFYFLDMALKGSPEVVLIVVMFVIVIILAFKGWMDLLDKF